MVEFKSFFILLQLKFLIIYIFPILSLYPLSLPLYLFIAPLSLLSLFVPFPLSSLSPLFLFLFLPPLPPSLFLSFFLLKLLIFLFLIFF